MIKASIVIITKNRRSSVINAIRSAVAQGSPNELEVIVIDDGSQDGTVQEVARQFPTITLVSSDSSKGYIYQRNVAARMAKGEIIFSIDDDACFSSPTIVRTIIGQFSESAIGAVAIPFIDVLKDPKVVKQQAPNASGIFVCGAYIGTAHALRKDLFIELSGYRTALFHQGEESDYCLRMLARRRVVSLGRSEPILHYESPSRSFRRMDIYGRRNNILFGWHNLPGSLLLPYWAATTYNGIRHGLRVKRLFTMLEGLVRGYLDIRSEWQNRSPIASSVYRLHRQLSSNPATPLDEVTSRLNQLS